MRGAVWLVFEDGSTFTGQRTVTGQYDVGEVVFNTALTGYQEILTDPSYAGQMVVLTYPLIGSYGTAPAWAEAVRPAARALLVHRLQEASHGQSVWSLEEYCRRYEVTLVTGLDTRAITRYLRQEGTKRAALADSPEAFRAARERAHALSLAGVVDTVSTRHAYTISGDGPHVAVVDYGVKQGILDQLVQRGLRVTVVPAAVTATQLDALGVDGVVLSNGPGDPEDLSSRLDLVKHAVDHYPTLGICLGHQLVGLAAGGRTYPLKFGHHGSNHPVMDQDTGRIQITSQNHGYAVAEASLPPDYRIRFINLHDNTVEGLVHKTRPVLTVQHHPEAGPGPGDADYIFDEFVHLVHGGRVDA